MQAELQVKGSRWLSGSGIHLGPVLDTFVKDLGHVSESAVEPQSKPGWMKVGKGQSQPEIVAAAFRILYLVRGSPFLHHVLIVTQLLFVAGQLSRSVGRDCSPPPTNESTQPPASRAT